MGKVFTWTGVAAGGLGLLVMASGAMSFGSLNILGGAWAWTMGAGALGVGAVALAIGIPIWAVSSGRVTRIRHQLSLGQPTIQVDPRTGAALFGWKKQF